MKISYIFVISDFLHLGILQFIKEAKRNSDYLICGVLTDKAATEIRNEVPINSYKDRLEVIKSIKYIDEIMEQNSFSPLNNIKKIQQHHKQVHLFYGRTLKKYLDFDSFNSHNISSTELPFETRYKEEVLAKKIYSSSLIHNNIELFENTFLNNSIFKYYKFNSKNIFSTKAGTLKNISNLLKKSKVEKAYVFRVVDYKNNKNAIIKDIQTYFKNQTLVIRSSALNEDTTHESKAGFYDSVLNVQAKFNTEISEAIDKVITSYINSNHDYLYNEVLIQKQTTDILINGVVFTTDIEKKLPYYIINYSHGDKTDIVTGGLNNSQTKIISKYIDTSKLDNPYKKLIQAIQEIEKIIVQVPLDIEFAVTNDLKVIIFQVRPLVKVKTLHQKTNKKNIQNLSKKFNKKMFLSDMAFWNPAELIGDNPKPLAHSLFQKLITSSAWNVGLQDIGYPKNETNLLQTLLNKPYINMDIAFKSLIPINIDKKLTKKLIKYYKSKLINHPSLHDKIEFDIILTHFTAGFKNKKLELKQFGFTQKEILYLEKSLISITEALIHSYTNYQNKTDAQIATLISLQKKYKNLTITNVKMLIEDCIQFGTIPFSQAARIAFISKSIFNDFEKQSIITKEELNLLESLPNTILSQLNQDIKNLSSKKISRKQFNSKYGHLRAGTYNICSPKYSNIESFKNYVDRPLVDSTLISNIEIKINQYFLESNINISFDNLLHLYINSTENREYYKYVYSKNISLILDILTSYGKKHGISKKSLNYLDIEDIKLLTSDYKIVTQYLKQQKKNFKLQSFIKLPQIIISKDNFYQFDYIESQINFVGNKTIIGDTVFINAQDSNVNLDSKIVLIENADPGFHWIFSKNIKGLITKYGGVASHMTICCNEFGITAAIGCGDSFESLKNKRTIEIDPLQKRLN